MKTLANITATVRKLTAKCALIPCAAFVFMSAAFTQDVKAADISFGATVMSASNLSIMPERAKLDVFGKFAAIDIAVSTGMNRTPVFKAQHLDGQTYPPKIITLKQINGAYFARIEIQTNEIRNERIVLCAETSSRPLCSRIIINNHG